MYLERPSGAPPARGSTALFHHLVRLGERRKGWRMVIMRVSRLAPESRTEQHRRIAFTVFSSSLRGTDGELFVLGNGDVVFIGRRADSLLIDSAIKKQAELFKDDPLLTGENGGERFHDLFDLEQKFDDVMQLVRASVADEERERRQPRETNGVSGAILGPKQALDLDHLARLEKVLSSADISNLVRQQPVCAVASNMMARRVLDECFTSITDLERILAPGTDVARNRSLFQYLTLILDDRMLAYLKRGSMKEFERYFSVNLNVASILSPSFLAFDANMPTGIRGTIVIELQQGDVFTDLRSFGFARDFIRSRGYRVCLDGVDHQSLAYVDRQRLGIDLVKLHWSEDMACRFDSPAHAELRRHMDNIGPEHIILHRCEDERAVRFGQSLGIKMYQGRHIDVLLPLSDRRGRSALDPLH